VSHARYSNFPGTPAAVVESLEVLRALGGHQFWPDDITLLDPHRVDSTRLLNSSQVTDSYLLALACAHGGKLATFDRHLVTAAVVNGAQALHCII
jgi:predicted nucleic acid-binding protein